MLHEFVILTIIMILRSIYTRNDGAIKELTHIYVYTLFLNATDAPFSSSSFTRSALSFSQAIMRGE